MTDGELLNNYVANGDSRAFETLVEKYLGIVTATATRRCGDYGLAEEAVQNTFTILARKASRLSNHPTLAGWIHRTALYETGRLLRGEHNRKRKMDQLADETRLANTESLSAADREGIDLALGNLRPADRDVLLLRFFEGLSFREIGEQMGKSEAAAQKHAERSLAKMRGLLGRSSPVIAGSLVAALQGQFVADASATSAEITRTALASASSVPFLAVIANTFVTMSYSKPIAIAAVLLLFALPIAGEIRERSTLKQAIADFEPSPPPASARGMASVDATGSSPNLPPNDRGAATANANIAAQTSTPKSPIETAREIGTMMGEFKSYEYALRKKYPDGAPKATADNFSEYVADIDIVTRKMVKLATSPDAQGFDDAMNDPEQGGNAFALLIGTSIGLEEAESLQLVPLFSNAIERRERENLKQEDRSDDPDAWHAGIRLLHEDVAESMKTILSDEQVQLVKDVNGSHFLTTFSFSISTGKPNTADNE